MSLFNRNKLPKGNTYSGEIVEGKGLFQLLRNNPLSTHFDPVCRNKPRDLVNYMIALQVKRFGFHIDMGYPILVRNMKLLLARHDAMMLKRTIKYCSLIADHPFSTKFINEHIEVVKEKMR
jgi:hypothetical protein